jgi:signal transduction histidine kinase
VEVFRRQPVLRHPGIVVRERPWVTPVGLAVVGLVIAANAAGGVGLGVSGDALVVTAGVAVYVVVAVLFLLWADAPGPVVMGLLLAMSVAAAVTHHGDPTGSGGIGLYLGMAFAPLRLEVLRAAVTCSVGVLLFDAQLLLEAPNAGVFILVVDGGAGFFFLLGLLLRREGEQRAQVTRLLADLEASREAEKAAAALAERSRLAREMHDVLAHTLSGLVLQLEGLRLLADARGADPEVAQGLHRAHRLARTGLQESRQAITALRGGIVPGPEALPDLVAEHRAVTGHECRFVERGVPRPLGADVGLAVYRTAQEALSNVRKHAPGADVTVALCWEPNEVRLEVQDTGRPVTVGGSPPHSPGSTAGYGLTGMAERSELAGGRLEAGPTERGFRIELRLPAPQGNE